jgi:hypothetical protein
VRRVRGGFKIKVLEDKLTATRIRWYRHVLSKMPKRKIKLKTVTTHEEKLSHKRKEEYGNMTRKRSSGKTDTDGKAWLQDNSYKKWKCQRK